MTAPDWAALWDQLDAPEGPITCVYITTISRDGTSSTAHGPLADWQINAVRAIVGTARIDLLADADAINAQNAAAPMIAVVHDEPASPAKAHGWTKHGHHCCDRDRPATVGMVARCGGAPLCPKCATDVARIHAGVVL